jgi:hypothetical protein
MKHCARIVFRIATIAVIACAGSIAQAETDETYHVANTRPPDAFLSLRTKPSSATGARIATMPNGTPLKVLERRSDGWWYVRILSSGPEGWALSRQGNSVWIVCCATAEMPSEQGTTSNTVTRCTVVHSPKVYCKKGTGQGKFNAMKASTTSRSLGTSLTSRIRPSSRAGGGRT